MAGTQSPSLPAVASTESFFMQAWRLGRQEKILSEEDVIRILADGAKGIVQIADYFGTSNLRPDLEIAARRFEALLSLNLSHKTDGAVAEAAKLLASKSLLSLSKGGADLLRLLFSLPSEEDFLFFDRPDKDEIDQDLALATYLKPIDLRQYRLASDEGLRIRLRHEFCEFLMRKLSWLAVTDDVLAMPANLLNTVFLVWCGGEIEVGRPTASKLHDILQSIARLKPATIKRRLDNRILTVETKFQEIASEECSRFKAEVLARIELILRNADEVTISDFFYTDEDIDEQSRLDYQLSTEIWNKITKKKCNDEELASVFLLMACGLNPKPYLIPSDIRKIANAYRLGSFNPELVSDFILQHSPPARRDHIGSLWSETLLPGAVNHLGDPNPGSPLFKEAEQFLRDICIIRNRKRKASPGG